MRIGDDIAALDQTAAAARRWAIIFAQIRDSLMVVGVPGPTALEIAREWMLELLARDDDGS